MYIHVQHTKTLFLCHFKLLSDDIIQLHDTSNCHWMPIILLRCWPESKVDASGGVRLHQVCLGVIHLPPYNCKNKIKLKRLISSRTCACRILLSVYAIKKQYLLVKFSHLDHVMNHVVGRQHDLPTDNLQSCWKGHRPHSARNIPSVLEFSSLEDPDIQNGNTACIRHTCTKHAYLVLDHLLWDGMYMLNKRI